MAPRTGVWCKKHLSSITKKIASNPSYDTFEKLNKIFAEHYQKVMKDIVRESLIFGSTTVQLDKKNKLVHHGYNGRLK